MRKLENGDNMIEVIRGGQATDDRGTIRFVNDFDMSKVKRFYIIKNADVKLVRGWRAHRIEQRWLYVMSGAFCLDFVQIDNWIKPSLDLPIERKIIQASDTRVVHVPAGYGTAIQALEENSEVLVFSDYGIDHAKNDDYTWPQDFFIKRAKPPRLEYEDTYYNRFKRAGGS